MLSSYSSSTYVPSVEKQWLRHFSVKTKPVYLRLSNGYRARAALGANLKAVEIPRQWYNLIADLPVKPPPYLHSKTLEPAKPEDLSALFPDELIKQEASTEKFIDIPDEVLDVYSLWRPTPLIRFVLLLYIGFIFLSLEIFFVSHGKKYLIFFN